VNTYRLTVWRGDLRETKRYLVNAPTHTAAIAAAGPLLKLSRHTVIQAWEQLTADDVKRMNGATA
jgi:hypothetical protein